MSKYFDMKTKQLHDVDEKTRFDAKGMLKVHEPEPNERPVPTLRRQNAGINLRHAPTFFSTQNKQVLSGNFDLRHPSNNDLIAIAGTIVHGC